MPDRTRTDDGCRHMPKLKCPYGNHRFADVPDVNFRNVLELRKLKDSHLSEMSAAGCSQCENPAPTAHARGPCANHITAASRGEYIPSSRL